MRQVPQCHSVKITLLASIGSGLEYYDFTIYALLASFISQQFFPHDNHYAALIATFSIFAIGYFVRPLGGIIFGILGDRLGRKKTLSAALWIMAIATFTMGLVPTFATWGMGAAVLFAGLRVLQGISFGAELPGALTFLTEHVEQKRRGLYCGCMVASVGVGATLGSLVAYVLTASLPPSAMHAWGWRIPFLLGGVIGVIGYCIRRNTSETPCFKVSQKTYRNAFIVLIRTHFKKMLVGFALLLLPAALVIFYLCIPTYFHDAYGYNVRDIYSTMTLGFVPTPFLLPLFGWLSDRIGRKKIFLTTVFAFMLLDYFLFHMLYAKSLIALMGFVLLYQTIISALASCYFALLAEHFPTDVRYTGIAFCYNVTYALVALTPMLTLSWNPQIFFIILACLAMIGGLCIREGDIV